MGAAFSTFSSEQVIRMYDEAAGRGGPKQQRQQAEPAARPPPPQQHQILPGASPLPRSAAPVPAPVPLPLLRPTQARATIVDHSASPVMLADVLQARHTGDLILVWGTSWRDRLQQWCTWRTFSHVAMLDMSGGIVAPFLWESVSEHRDGCADVLTSTEAAAPGPRLVDAHVRLAGHAARCGIAQNKSGAVAPYPFCKIAVVSLHVAHDGLSNNNDGGGSSARMMMAQSLQAHIERTHPASEQARTLASVQTILKEDSSAPQSAAELVVGTYRAMCVLAPRVGSDAAAAAFHPDDFVFRRDRLRFLAGFGLDDEVHVYKVYCAPDPFLSNNTSNQLRATEPSRPSSPCKPCKGTSPATWHSGSHK